MQTLACMIRAAGTSAQPSAVPDGAGTPTDKGLRRGEKLQRALV